MTNGVCVMCDRASVMPEPRDTGARVMESGDSHQYRIISDIREGFKKKKKKIGNFPTWRKGKKWENSTFFSFLFLNPSPMSEMILYW